MKTYKKYITAILACAAACLCAIHLATPSRQSPKHHPRDYAQITSEGIIRAVTEYDHTSYFVNGDTLSGFHYELIQTFAREHGLQSKIMAEMAFNRQLEGLAAGEYDLIAHGVLATSELKDSLLLTIPIVLNRQVLVQRKDTDTIHSKFIRNQLELAGKTVHIVKDSPSMLRIQNLSNEIGDTIYIQEIEKYGAEQLAALVAHGDIDYAVCDESIASIMADSLPQIDISIAIGFTQFHSWAVSKQSPVLLDSLNKWLESYKQRKEYRTLCRKYGLSPSI